MNVMQALYFKMRRPFSENIRWYGMVVGLGAVLVLLAVLQYRSVRAVSEATTAQMRVNLQGSLMDVRQGLERELTPLCRELQSGSEPTGQNDFQEYAVRFERWRRAAAHPTLVDAVFIWQQRDAAHFQLLKMNASRAAFEPVPWPDDLRLRERLVELGPAPDTAAEGRHSAGPPPDREFGGEPPFPRDAAPPCAPNDPGPPTDDGKQSYRRPEDHPLASERPAPRESMQHHPPPRSERRIPPFSPQPAPSFSWTIDENVPALIHSFHESISSGARREGPPAVNWIVITLDRQVLAQHILPELVERYFGTNKQSAYDIAVTEGDSQAADLYTSHSGFDRQKDFVPDATLNLFGRPIPMVAGKDSLWRGMIVPLTSARMAQAMNHDSTDSSATFQGTGPFHIRPIHYTPGQRGWEIVAKHREGSVEAAVAALSRRNLMFNFAVLLVLAATMGMIIATSLRGRRLARLQMDFVANVSHELRTPLTGIISAAQNVADGLIDDKQRMARYGQAIVGEAQQLSELVEQILLFSATQKDHHRYHIQPVDVAEVIEFSLKNTSALIHSAGITVEREIQRGLPTVSADFKALSHCLQNLITNALKYGGDGRCLAVRAIAANGSNGAKEIRISVTDKGIGISREELTHIFEPFYRTAEATAAQIHGSGLGLPLAKSITEGMGGWLTVQSEPGEGSTFTVHLPFK
jgi:signal transduction histidine kinase